MAHLSNLRPVPLEVIQDILPELPPLVAIKRVLHHPPSSPSTFENFALKILLTPHYKETCTSYFLPLHCVNPTVNAVGCFPPVVNGHHLITLYHIDVCV
jgi:hypothetical protein